MYIVRATGDGGPYCFHVDASLATSASTIAEALVKINEYLQEWGYDMNPVEDGVHIGEALEKRGVYVSDREWFEDPGRPMESAWQEFTITIRQDDSS